MLVSLRMLARTIKRQVIETLVCNVGLLCEFSILVYAGTRVVSRLVSHYFFRATDG